MTATYTPGGVEKNDTLKTPLSQAKNDIDLFPKMTQISEDHSKDKQTAPSSNNENENKTNDDNNNANNNNNTENTTLSTLKSIFLDPLKLSLMISIIALLITIIIAATTSQSVNTRLTGMESEYNLNGVDAFGVTNINQTYQPGGYFGWQYSSSYPDMYPLQDIHASVGDRIFFTAPSRTSEDVWLVPRKVWESCQFTEGDNMVQIAIAKWLRADTYFRNESCIINQTVGCNQNGWMQKEYNYPGGYSFLIQV